MRFAQIVMGPAGTGKSTYCSYMQENSGLIKRHIKVVNLDPAAEEFSYTPLADIKDLISVEDVLESDEISLGPNGALIYCMEFLLRNMDWLFEEIGEDIDCDYIIFDCPGQIELYTHMDIMPNLIKHLEEKLFRVMGVYTIDATFAADPNKFIGGTLSALSSMVMVSIPHINILTKMDLLGKKERKKLDFMLDNDFEGICQEVSENVFSKKHAKLTQALGKVVDDFGLVKYFTLDITKEDQILALMTIIDMTLNVSDDIDTIPQDFDEADEENDDN